MVIDMNYWIKVLKRLSLFIISIAIIFLGLKLAIFYIPFLIGFIISLLIEPIIKFISKKTSLTRKTSSIIVLIIFFMILLSLITFGIITLITESYNLLQNSNVYLQKIYDMLSKINLNRLNLPDQIVSLISSSTENVISFINNFIVDILTNILQGIKSLPIIGVYIVITILSTYFICSDKLFILDQLEHHFPSIWLKKFRSKLKKIISSLGCYLKAEAILVGITFLEVLLGLYIFKWLGLDVKFPLIIAIVIAFVDALPILGAGTVLTPWAIISAFNGNITLGICLIVLYVIVLVVRQFLEPRIVSSKIGIHPIFTLIAMYTGFKISGLIGLFIGPIIFIILKDVFSTMIDEGVVKNIMNRI